MVLDEAGLVHRGNAAGSALEQVHDQDTQQGQTVCERGGGNVVERVGEMELITGKS